MPTSGGVRLDGGPVLTDTEHSVFETDASSILSFSEGFAGSDSDENADRLLHDYNKYRLPEGNKTRLNLRTKEPLSPTPRPPAAASVTQNHTAATPTMPPSPPPRTDSNENIPYAHIRRNDSSDHFNASDSDFIGSGISRAGSIYTLSRVSFEGQLSKLTSMRLPDASSLAKRIASLPTATDAAKALADASEQIMVWIRKASDVLNGLNAEDDVEWAAAGGREGIEDVDKAINRFEGLVQVYILSIERLQTRPDLATLSMDELTGSVLQMDGIITCWNKIKETLRGVKAQVEIAMEWEELWNTVLGEIGQELQGLNRLVFEMEEKRHDGTESVLATKTDEGIDLNELETIVEEQPNHSNSKGQASSHLSLLQPFSPTSPLESLPNQDSKESNENTLLALFARMQPLRASLDFLPMRLSQFNIRGSQIFPTAGEDLELRREQLEGQWRKLEADAESLRKELGEDKWVLVFRNAGRQALKMYKSVIRSYNKLKLALENGEQAGHMPSLTNKIESYEVKKTHYGPAIERVLAIIDRGVQDRLTLNGEILRLQSDMKRMWSTLQSDMADIDILLEDVTRKQNTDTTLRDSPSRSLASSMRESADTPISSPASSVIGTTDSRNNSFQGSRTPTPLLPGKSRQGSFGSSRPSKVSPRPSSRIGSTSSMPNRTSFGLTIRGQDRALSTSPSPLAARSESATKKSQWPSRSPLNVDPSKPRWSTSTRVETHDFPPLSATEPSPYVKTPVYKRTSNNLRSVSNPVSSSTPTGRHTSLTPSSTSTRPSSSLHYSSPSTPSAQFSKFNNPKRKSSLPIPSRGPDLFSDGGNDADTESPSIARARPVSVMASGRRSSMLPARPAGERATRPASVLGNPSASNSARNAAKRISIVPQRPMSTLDVGKAMAAAAEEERPKWRI
ncbi:karyogamy protein [Polychaeton citri CBS 116435]|uniref:Karyogamy protein n=1 Tax=Polychaeton citri CBS 116435 TaxID=1314669 RepID=A0A9P4Q8D7_9PEZI|nr:karyogamy protein [Polychaeton citri CBS 116435]